MTMRNRLANTKNYFQGDSKKVLCVGSAGLFRSPTTANVLHREFGYNTRAAGVSEKYGLIIVDQALLHWADEIVTMELAHYKVVEDLLKEYNYINKDLYCLDVPDVYGYMVPELQEILLDRYKEVNEDDGE